MNDRHKSPRFTVVTTEVKRTRGSESYRLVMNDLRETGLVLHATVSRTLEAADRHLRLERFEIRLTGSTSEPSSDVVSQIGDPRWVRAALLAITAHLNVAMDPRATGHGHLDGAADRKIRPLRMFWRSLQGGGRKQDAAPLPPITQESVEQLMEEIDAFLANSPGRRSEPDSE